MILIIHLGTKALKFNGQAQLKYNMCNSNFGANIFVTSAWGTTFANLRNFSNHAGVK